METRSLVSATVALACTFASSLVYAAGFQCPAVADLNTPASTTEIKSLLPLASLLSEPSQMASAITLLREHGMSADNSINHLIAFYCPTVATKENLSDTEKTEEVRRFARQVTSAVLRMNSVDEVIFDVPLNPDIAEAVKARAQQEGLTVEAWIARSAEAAIN